MAVSSPEFHPEALREADAGLLWYLERSPAAAHRFMAELERAIDHICDAPERCPALRSGDSALRPLEVPVLARVPADQERGADSRGGAFEADAGLLEAAPRVKLWFGCPRPGEVPTEQLLRIPGVRDRRFRAS